MADTPVTVQQLLRQHFILKLVSERRANGTVMQDTYNMRPGSSITDRRSGDTASWDIFDHTRTMASPRPRVANASTRNQFPVKVRTATTVRCYEKFHILWEKLLNFRPPGGNVGELDPGGQRYVTLQISRFLERFLNTQEYMFVRMLMGGFGIQARNENDYVFTELGAGDFNVDFQIPTTNLSSGTFNTLNNWSTTSTDILGQLLDLNYLAEDLSGYPIKHIWMNSKTFNYLLQNDTLQAVGGSAFRIWDRLTQTEVQSPDGSRMGNYSMILRAWPLIQFHAYDQGVKVATDDDGSTTRLIPDDAVICTPDIGEDWYGNFEGSEVVQEGPMGSPKEVFGFHSWNYATHEPAGMEVHMLNNSLPILYVPNAVFYDSDVS